MSVAELPSSGIGGGGGGGNRENLHVQNIYLKKQHSESVHNN